MRIVFLIVCVKVFNFRYIFVALVLIFQENNVCLHCKRDSSKHISLSKCINSFTRMFYLIVFFIVSYSNQEVVIRDGVTSDGEVLDKITPRSSYGKPFHSTRGFYIRYRGRVRPMDNLQIVFTSYRERGSSGK